MLVLTRKLREHINIYTPAGIVRIAWLGEDRDGHGARIGIDAPPSILILREELERGKEDGKE